MDELKKPNVKLRKDEVVTPMGIKRVPKHLRKNMEAQQQQQQTGNK